MRKISNPKIARVYPIEAKMANGVTEGIRYNSGRRRTPSHGLERADSGWRRDKEPFCRKFLIDRMAVVR
jgi:hypothetical protein